MKQKLGMKHLGLMGVVVAMGLVSGSKSDRKLNDQTSGELPAKTVEQYWAETGINTEHLLKVLSRENCTADKRNFLACANAVSMLAHKQKKHVGISGEISADMGAKGFESEVERLKSWGVIEPSTSDLNFVQIAVELLGHLDVSQKPAAIGSAINAYLSVAEDPHSYLLPKKYFQEVVSKADHKSKTMGFIVAKKSESLIIKKVVPGSPIADAGVRVGDELVAMNGERIGADKMSNLSDLIRERQRSSSSIDLTVKRGSEVIEYTVPFKDFTYATVTSQWLNKDKKVAILGITKFSKGLCELVKSELKKLKSQGLEGLILDLRDNSGGQMSEAACVTSLFVGADKPIFTIRFFNDQSVEEIYMGKEQVMYSKPLAVVINDGTASAAEIVAGSLQDYARGPIVGTRSFGKGSFQEPEELEGLSGLFHFKTKGFYYLPSGRSPQLTGVIPDLEIPSFYGEGEHELSMYLFPLKPEVSQGKIIAGNFGKCDLGSNQILTTSPDVEVERAAQVLQCAHR